MLSDHKEQRLRHLFFIYLMDLFSNWKPWKPKTLGRVLCPVKCYTTSHTRRSHEAEWKGPPNTLMNWSEVMWGGVEERSGRSPAAVYRAALYEASQVGYMVALEEKLELLKTLCFDKPQAELSHWSPQAGQLCSYCFLSFFITTLFKKWLVAVTWTVWTALCQFMCGCFCVS